MMIESLATEKFAQVARHSLLLGLMLVAVTALAQTASRDAKIDDKAYRGSIEEVIIRAQKPRWREQEKPGWRPNKVKLPTRNAPRDIEWMPEYNKDERDTIPTEQERKFERPEIKVFEWKF